MLSFHVLCPPSCKHEAWYPCIQGVAKDWGRKICSWSLGKNGDQLIENLSQETIFLATTLGMDKFWNCTTIFFRNTPFV